MLTKPCCTIDFAESRHQNSAKVFKMKMVLLPGQFDFLEISHLEIPNVFFFSLIKLAGDESKGYPLFLNRTDMVQSNITYIAKGNA